MHKSVVMLIWDASDSCWEQSTKGSSHSNHRVMAVSGLHVVPLRKNDQPMLLRLPKCGYVENSQENSTSGKNIFSEIVCWHAQKSNQTFLML